MIKERIGTVAYRLHLPPDSKIHPVFHVSLLKKKRGDAIAPNPNMPPIDAICVFHWQPKAILDRGLFKKKNVAITKWLVKWSGLPIEDATWEQADDILTHYPNFTT